ncbi:semaphorin-6C isoform X4 [Tenrec ecaudatus]|uniref:semaphorin-6C isoform X4 n=1 Tax=Tenrec ecaudatus TaxID=94439 RepID=UPI003F598550
MPRAPYFMPLLLLLLSLPHTHAAFPRDPHPLLSSDLQGTSPLSWFRGLEDDAVAVQLGLDFQKFLTLNRTLLVAARDHVFAFDLQAQEEGKGLVPSKYLTWRSQDVDNCAVRGKLTDECYNYIRVLIPWDSQTLLACGTNSFSPVCRSYGITSLQQEGEELSGQARCPFDATQSNVAVFAEGSLYSATAADFQASDAVVYRSLGPQPPLRSAKYDSKWLREPYFVHALEHGDHVYFFFREVSVEDARLGRVQFSRVARVCKRDMGGSPRALDRHWTSFLKLRLNCSVPGDSIFYFDVLQALTGPANLHGRSALFGVFTTQTNSIPGSAVCAFYLDDIEHGFEGKFKEQRSLDGAWTPVSEDRVPSPRPGSCAGVGGAASFSTSRDLPDAVLTFIKAHPLLDPAVPPATHQPLLTLTSRALLTQVAVDGMAGPHSNTTVLFLGSNDGTVLKVLPPGGRPGGTEPILLEEIDAYSSSRCSGKRSSKTARRVLGLELDTEGHRLFVAFSGCMIYLPLSRCTRHGACQRSCLASQDPYCGWHRSRGCVDIRGPALMSFGLGTRKPQTMVTAKMELLGVSLAQGILRMCFWVLALPLRPPAPSVMPTPGPSLPLLELTLRACAGTSSQPRPPLPSPSHSSWPAWPQPSPWAPRPQPSWSPAPAAAPTDAGARTSRPQGSRALSPSAVWPGCTAGAQTPRRRPRTETRPRRPSSTPLSCLPPRACPRRSWPACPPRSPPPSCQSSTSAPPLPGAPGSGTRTATTPRRARSARGAGIRRAAPRRACW